MYKSPIWIKIAIEHTFLVKTKTKIEKGGNLAFPCENPNDVDESFTQLVIRGAIPIHEPQNMPWNQRTALFADPDGNIHEIFAEIE